MTDYNTRQIATNEEREEEAFRSLMSLLRENGVTDNATIQEVIRLWVTGTHALETVGWHQGYAMAQD